MHEPFSLLVPVYDGDRPDHIRRAMRSAVDDQTVRPDQVSLGKLNNVREALKMARECRTILGANGITLEYPVIRHMNNLESVLTYEGTPEVHQLILGKAVTGLDAFS